MDGEPRRGAAVSVVPDPAEYTPPRVARVLTPAELDREILYAGDVPSER
jgi:hypothetical protein